MGVLAYIRRNDRLRKLAGRLYSMTGGNKTHISGRNNYVNTSGLFMKGCSINISGDDNVVDISESIYRISNVEINIYGSGNCIRIGRNFATDGLCFSIEDNGNKIILGEECHGGGASELAAIEGTEIRLGNDCMLSANITIRTGDSHSVLDSASGRRINPSKSVKIGNHVWIANTVLIFKGTEIGDGSVVAGGSVVTGKRFPANCIIGGNPAGVLKEGVNWCSERIKV